MAKWLNLLQRHSDRRSCTQSVRGSSEDTYDRRKTKQNKKKYQLSLRIRNEMYRRIATVGTYIEISARTTGQSKIVRPQVAEIAA